MREILLHLWDVAVVPTQGQKNLELKLGAFMELLKLYYINITCSEIRDR